MSVTETAIYQNKRTAPLPQGNGKPAADGFLKGLLAKDISLFGKELSDKKKERFYSELHILMEAGVGLKPALELIEQEQTRAKDKELFKQIKEQVIKGSSLYEAIKETNRFSPYEYYSIQIGEESGRLPAILKELSGFFTKKIKQKRQMVSALTYPAIVIMVAAGAVLFMMKFIVPMFADIFKRFGGELPYITRVIINASQTLGDYLLLFTAIVAGLTVFLFGQRNTDWFRRTSSTLIQKIPVIGPLIKKIYLARFCQSMALLIGAKINLTRALDLVRQMAGFYPIESTMYSIKQGVIKGQSLHQSMAAIPFYDKRTISLIKVGEEVNQLDTIFDKLARQYNEEVEHQSALLGTLLEPAIIIFLGLLVGLILIAMYLPLFQMSGRMV